MKLTGSRCPGGRSPKDVILRSRPTCSRSKAAPERSSSTSARAWPTRSAATGQAPPSATWAPRSVPPARCSVHDDQNMADYLKATGREGIADVATSKHARSLCAQTTTARPEYDRVVEIDLDQARAAASTARIHPDLAHTSRRSKCTEAPPRRERAGPCEISSPRLIGSCTNSSYEDITRAASIARQAARQARPDGAQEPILLSRLAPSRSAPPSSATA